MTADRRDQLAETLRRDAIADVIHAAADEVGRCPENDDDSSCYRAADALLPVIDRMIRQAQAEALESAANDLYERSAAPTAAGWLLARAAALRATTDHVDQPEDGT